MNVNRLVGALVVVLALPRLHAEEDRAVDRAARLATIEAAAAVIERTYVDADLASRMARVLRDRATSGAYDRATTASALAKQVTADLFEVSGDAHLQMFADHQPNLANRAATPMTPDRKRQIRDVERLRSGGINHGFKRVERLDGNVGYLRIDLLSDPQFGAETATAAMTFVAPAHALIIDLRNCNGGFPEMVALLATYVFEGDIIHLNTLESRASRESQQFWTLPHVPGPRFGAQKDVFVLTSRKTASAAEELAYDLQQRKRATVVGEVTAGAANPGGTERLNEDFLLFLPTWKAVNPVSGKNWEGVGVQPDVVTTADDALRRAHLLALERLVTRGDEEWSGRWTATIEALRKAGGS